MAMTAWSAKVWSSAICWSVNGRTSAATDGDRADRRRRRAASARASDAPVGPSVARRRLRVARDPSRTSGMCDDWPRRGSPGRAALPRLGRIGNGSPQGLDALGRRAVRARRGGGARRRTGRRRRSRPRTAARRSAAIVSKTGWTSVGELEMTRRISPVAVCCSRASVRSRFRASSSLKRRTFSMAMTAWSAKVWSSSICASEKGPASTATDGDRPDRDALRAASAPPTDAAEWRPSATVAHARSSDPRGRPRCARWRAVRIDAAGGAARARCASGQAPCRASTPSACRPSWATKWRSVTVEPEDEAELRPHRAGRRSAAIVSKTGWTSVGELRDDAQDLAGGRLLLERLGEVAVPGLQLLEEADVLDGDDGLGGEGLEELDLLVGERAELHAAEQDRADRHPLAQEGSGERGSVAVPLRVGRALRELGVGRGEIVHVDELPIDHGPPRHPVAVDGRGLADRPEGVGPDLGRQAKHLALDPEEIRVRHVAEPRGVLDDGFQHRLHVGGGAADDRRISPAAACCSRLSVRSRSRARRKGRLLAPMTSIPGGLARRNSSRMAACPVDSITRSTGR